MLHKRNAPDAGTDRTCPFTIQSTAQLLPTSLFPPLVSTSRSRSHLPTMNNFDYTDADFDAALRLDLHEDMRSHSHDCAPQSNDFQDFNAPHDTASTPAPTTLMGTFTQTNYTYPVSKQRLDRRHSLNLPHHRVSRRFGPRAQVSPPSQ